MNFAAPAHCSLLPDYHLDEQPDGSFVTSIVFPERFCGVIGVVHGGVVSMLFDELLGSVANPPSGEWWATASLTVNYRAPSPIGVELRAVVERGERHGRKCAVRGKLFAGDMLCAEAEGLFVKVR